MGEGPGLFLTGGFFPILPGVVRGGWEWVSMRMSWAIKLGLLLKQSPIGNQETNIFRKPYGGEYTGES